MEIYYLKYKIEKYETHVRLLGEEFYIRNKIAGYFIYNNSKYKLQEKIETRNIKEDELKIELRFFKRIYNKRFMFKDCNSLIKFSIYKNKSDDQLSKQNEILKKIEENLIDSSNKNYSYNEELYKGIEDFESFSEFSEISQKRNFKNSGKSIIKDIMNNLKKTQDYSIDLSGMFYECSSLLSMTDIYEWNSNNIINMDGLFYGCSSLI